jgi:sporulation-control protein spo0M
VAAEKPRLLRRSRAGFAWLLMSSNVDVDMKYTHKRTVAVLALATVDGLTGMQGLDAQPSPAVKRKLVLKQDMEIPGREAGDAVLIAPGKIHQTINNSSFTAKLGVVFVAEKGRPLTTPVD